jgi:hypothetical protein
MRAWIHQRGEINAAKAEIVERQAVITQLQLEKQRWKDPAYVEIQARKRFGWLMPGETGFRVIDNDGDVLSSGEWELSDPVDVESQADEQWWQRGWGSVVEAGKTPEELAAELAETQPENVPAERITPRDAADDEDPSVDGAGDR